MIVFNVFIYRPRRFRCKACCTASAASAAASAGEKGGGDSQLAASAFLLSAPPGTALRSGTDVKEAAFRGTEAASDVAPVRLEL